MAHPDPRFPLYRPDLERDACGIGLVADARGRRGHEIVEHALSALVRLTHRGAPPQTVFVKVAPDAAARQAAIVHARAGALSRAAAGGRGPRDSS